MKSAEQSLANLRVLVCRPEPKASALCRDLGALGADARALPMIAIRPLPETPESRALIQDFDLFGHIVVVSPIAAEFLLTELDTWWPQRPVGQSWYAIGQGTARRLQQAGIDCLAAYQGHDSESLLTLPALHQLQDEKVLICGGEGGRPLLAESLRARGARVEKLALYQRLRPDYPKARITDVLVRFDPQAIVVLSGETLNNLLALGQNADRSLLSRLLLVPTERVAEQARRAGFARLAVAKALDTPALAASLEQALQRN
jgi:uroporphyrinogen-III synthase